MRLISSWQRLRGSRVGPENPNPRAWAPPRLRISDPPQCTFLFLPELSQVACHRVPCSADSVPIRVRSHACDVAAVASSSLSVGTPAPISRDTTYYCYIDDFSHEYIRQEVPRAGYAPGHPLPTPPRPAYSQRRPPSPRGRGEGSTSRL